MMFILRYFLWGFTVLMILVIFGYIPHAGIDSNAVLIITIILVITTLFDMIKFAVIYMEYQTKEETQE